MDQRKLLLLIGAGVIALTAGLAAKSMFSGAAAPVVQAVMPAVKGPRVLVAQRALPVGTIITADAVGYQQWPRDMVRDAYFLDGSVDMNKLLGTVVRYPITAGQPLTQGALVAPGDRGFLAAALSPGMRAITIPVSDKSAVAGFVFPGDHVDVMLTQTVHGAGMDSVQALNATETILRNLRVLATDQSPVSETENGKTVVRTFHTVTLEVTPRIAEQIEVAQSVGTLDLTLRSIADPSNPLDHAVASGTQGLADDHDRPSGPGLGQLFNADNHPIDGSSSFSTGGDISRFQRRTMPSMGPGLSTGGVKVVRGSTVSGSGGVGVAGMGMDAAIAPGA